MLTEPWRMRLLGRFEFSSSGRRYNRCRTTKMGAMLGYLALNLGREISRETLADLFWGESDPSAAQVNVRVALNSLRKQLEPLGVPFGSVLVNHGRSQVSLNPEAVTCDAVEFRTMLKRRPDMQHDERRDQLMTALDLYGGELMPGYYEEVIDEERNRLSVEFMDALQELSSLVKGSGDLDQAIRVARRMVDEDPYQEEAQCGLMNLLTLAGRHEEVLQQYENLERLYAQEHLGDPPDDARKLYERSVATAGPSHKKRHHPSDGPPTPVNREPEPLPERDLIPHPSSLIPHPSSLIPHPSSPGPPNATVEPAASPTTPQLPLQLTRFFGRHDELARLDELIQSGAARLITLTGTGGAGKTRLALEYAHSLGAGSERGVAFVPLADIVSVEHIPPAIAAAIRMEVKPGRDVMSQVEAYLSQRPWLLILDNLEQISDAVRDVVLRLLQNVSSLTIIATSRHALEVVGEQQFPVEPLPVPRSPGTPERLMEFACVQLFLDRSSKIVPDIQVTQGTAKHIAQLCQELEGLPLAIELAAGWSGELAPKQMVAKLATKFDLLVGRKAGLPARQSSLMASLEWSYRLIPPDLQRTFAALSVFRRGWTLDSLEAVCGMTNAHTVMSDLRSRSLIKVDRSGDEARYGMLEIIREFAAEKLTPGDRPFLAARHAAYYCRLAAEAQPQLRGADQAEWLGRLDAEHENLRSALQWSLTEDPPSGLRMVHDLFFYWSIRGHRSEGREWLDRAAAIAEARGDVRAHADTTGLAGAMAWAERDVPAALARAETSVALWRGIGDRGGLAAALVNLGLAQRAAGALDDALAAYRESLSLAEAAGNRTTAASALTNIAAAHLVSGDLAGAHETTERAMELHRAAGDDWGLSLAESNLGDIACQTYDAPGAWAHYVGSLKGLFAAGDLARGAHVLRHLAAVAAYQERDREAATLAGAAAAVHECLDPTFEPLDAEDFDETVRALQSKLPAESFQSAWANGAGMDISEIAEFVTGLPDSRSG